MDNDNAIRIKRLMYQSWYRGCKETDRILGHFARAHLAEFSVEELDRFEALMEENDADIFAWVTGKKPLPAEYVACPVMKQIMTFDVVSILSESVSL